MMESISNRKIEHIDTLLADIDADRSKGYFDEIRLKHRGLPDLNFADVDPSCKFLGKRLSMPFLISSMTGGAGDRLLHLNRNLAGAAEKAGVALAVGSERVIFKEESAKGSFELRQYAPTVPLLANLGAVQLNNGFGIDECREAVRVLDADALIFHLNPLQEVCQEGGDTDFSGLATKMGEIGNELEVPVVAKEVGAGFCVEDLELLIENGIDIVDIAGSGGVSWSRVEDSRNGKSETDKAVFDDWGIPTPMALRMLNGCLDRVKLIASGGVRTGVDMAKAIVMGASLCGMARPILDPALESESAVTELLEKIRTDFTRAMFLLGCSEVEAMRNREDLILL